MSVRMRMPNPGRAVFCLLCAAALLCTIAPRAGAAGENDRGVHMETYWWGVKAHELSREDRSLIEGVVYAESGGSSYEGMCAVAQVIRERAESWGLSAREVVEAKGQFAAPYRGKVSDEVCQAVAAVFDEGFRQFAGYTTHFHHENIRPYWTKSKDYRGTLDVQVFWGLDDPD